MPAEPATAAHSAAPGPGRVELADPAHPSPTDATAASADPSACAAAVSASVERLRRCAAAPRVAVVLGSGWDGISSLLDQPQDLPYAELPAFPTPGVAGHAGSLRIGCLQGQGQAVALLRGRKHAYEDGDAAAMKGAIRSLRAWGVQTLVLTNAAGSLRPDLPPGSLMLISDHLNLPQRTPLHGEPGNARFVSLVDAYDPQLRRCAQAAAHAAGLTLASGVYAWMLGPQFETPAEIRMLQRLGADAVGMSTVPETILARHAGLRVLGLSLITNLGAGMDAQALSHAHTLHHAQAAAAVAARLMAALLPALLAESALCAGQAQASPD